MNMCAGLISAGGNLTALDPVRRPDKADLIMAQNLTRSLERGLDILFAFCQERHLLTINEIAGITGIPKSTCYRLIKTLKNKNLIDFDRDGSRYRLGSGLLQLYSIISDSIDVSFIARPFMKHLLEITGETVQLFLHNRNNVAVCIDKMESPETLRVRPDKGTIINLTSGASGKAILAFLPPEVQDQIITEKGLKKYSPHTITDPEKLKKNLAQVRRLGYAESDQELFLGVMAVAAPIFDQESKVTASICVAGPRERLRKKKTTALATFVLEAAKSISRRMGGFSAGNNGHGDGTGRKNQWA